MSWCGSLLLLTRRRYVFYSFVRVVIAKNAELNAEWGALAGHGSADRTRNLHGSRESARILDLIGYSFSHLFVVFSFYHLLAVDVDGYPAGAALCHKPVVCGKDGLNVRHG